MIKYTTSTTQRKKVPPDIAEKVYKLHKEIRVNLGVEHGRMYTVDGGVVYMWYDGSGLRCVMV